jgi:nicotinic acid phosphoribosyltransferase
VRPTSAVRHTSFVAGAGFDLPTGGTIPHALVQAFTTEEEAFRAVAESLDRYSLLLDTYDVETAIETAVAVALDARARLGHKMVAVRLDSGDPSPTASTCGGSHEPGYARPRCSSRRHRRVPHFRSAPG